MQEVLGRKLLRGEDEDQQRHDQRTAADAEQAGQENRDRADREVGEPLH